MYLANTTTGDMDVLLGGKYEPSRDKEALECVAVFDGSSWRIEALVGTLGTKWVTGTCATRVWVKCVGERVCGGHTLQRRWWAHSASSGYWRVQHTCVG